MSSWYWLKKRVAQHKAWQYQFCLTIWDILDRKKAA